MARIVLLAVLAALLPAQAPAADYYRGLEAYERGDYETALGEWLPLAEQGDTESQYRVARMYYHGEGVADDAEAVRWYRKAAEGGHAISQNNLGLMLEQGRGAEQDLAEAARWYREAADQGVMTAQANLARLYDEGRGVPEDPGRAARLYRRAADAGHPESQYRLGRMFDEGRGVPRNPEKALKWYRRAAADGHLEAREALATRPTASSSKGKPKKPRKKEASEPPPRVEPTAAAPVPEPDPAPVPEPLPEPLPEELGELRDRAKQGDVEAQYRLARMYMRGDGVAQNQDEAGRWMLAAAEQGHPLAGYRVALMYLRAIGISQKKDYVQAYRWFELSARRGVGDAAAWRDKIAPKMSEQELAEAATLVREETDE